MSYVQSVYAKSTNGASSGKKVRGKDKWWKGQRIQDDTESPVITYNVNERNQQILEIVLERFKKAFQGFFM